MKCRSFDGFTIKTVAVICLFLYFRFGIGKRKTKMKTKLSTETKVKPKGELKKQRRRKYSNKKMFNMYLWLCVCVCGDNRSTKENGLIWNSVSPSDNVKPLQADRITADLLIVGLSFAYCSTLTVWSKCVTKSSAVCRRLMPRRLQIAND